jgi:hypothetical protein
MIFNHFSTNIELFNPIGIIFHILDYNPCLATIKNVSQKSSHTGKFNIGVYFDINNNVQDK